MNVNLRTSNGVVAVVDDLNTSTRTVHKYAVVEDRRRLGYVNGKHATESDLSKVVAEHKQSVTIHQGRVVDVEWTADPEASRELVERGAEIVLDTEADHREVPA